MQKFIKLLNAIISFEIPFRYLKFTLLIFLNL